MLATTGVFGVMAYSVGRRTREIEVRVALGAEGGDVSGMILRQGLRSILAGVAVGAALLACYFPARRATRVDPVVALRCE